MLVDHPTGSGKTREMIRVLDNFFLDPRPKVPIFPKEPVCRNFYAELLRWPSSYRDFFACMRPQDAARVAGARDWRSRREHLWDLSELPEAEVRALCSLLQEVLEMKGWFFMGKMRRSRMEAFQKRFPEEKMPAGPLRALRYTSAGGQHTELRNGRPISALLKVAFDNEGKNVYSNKIVIMDEAHNLARTQTQYRQQLVRLRDLLWGAHGMVLAGFTGTPILNEPEEGRQLLDIIKGRGAPPCDEGFLSSFPMRPAGLFPQSFPVGVPDSVLTPKLRRQLVRRVPLVGEPLQRYDAKRHKNLPERRLQRYCNLCVHFGSLHDGKSGSRARILANMKACAPKLASIAADVAERPEKALILVARHSGMEALLAHMREVAAASTPPFRVATMEDLAGFNAQSNRRGEQYRVLVADAVTCSEGVSFFAVRRVHLADVPAAPSAFIQSVGRAIRMYGHRGLPKEEQTVTTILHVAGLPRWMRSPLGAFAYRAQRRYADPRGMESRAKRLLRRLFRAGIRSFEALKARIDACGPRTPSSASQLEGSKKEPIGPAGIATFMEQLGLFDEAKALRAREKAGIAGKQRQKVKGHAAAAGAPKAAAAARATDSPQKGQGRQLGRAGSDAQTLAELAELIPTHSAGRQQGARPVRRASGPLRTAASFGSGGGEEPAAATPGKVSRQASGLSTTSAVTREQSQPAAVAAAGGEAVAGGPAARVPRQASGVEPGWRRDPLAATLADLQAAASAEEAAVDMRLSARTADEEALKELAERSRAFVPALTELRRKAIDRLILRGLGGELAQEGSEGESSAHEFGVSASSGEEHGAKGGKKETPLILPPGWHIETTRRGKKARECREFVDPGGRHYRTVKEARKAIDKARSLENMAQRVKSQYAASLLKKAESQRELVAKAEAGVAKSEADGVKAETAVGAAKREAEESAAAKREPPAPAAPGAVKVKIEPVDVDAAPATASRGATAAIGDAVVARRFGEPMDLEAPVKREPLDVEADAADKSTLAWASRPATTEVTTGLPMPLSVEVKHEAVATPTRRALDLDGTTPETAPPKRRLGVGAGPAETEEAEREADLPPRKRQSLAANEEAQLGKPGAEELLTGA